MTHQEILNASGLFESDLSGGTLSVCTPIDGSEIARLKTDGAADVAAMTASGVDAFKAWRSVPAPRRGELVRLIGE